MSLRITELNLRDFRSYSSFNLENISSLTIFVGMNATGKTNAIEAIQLLTSLSSFRNATTKELVREGQEEGYASITIEDGNRNLRVKVGVGKEKRKYLLNGKPKRPKDLKGLLPSVIFTPDDLDLIKGSNTKRRKELDLIGSQLNANYYQILKDYEKILRHKNALLKDEQKKGVIEAVNEIFITVAQQLTNYRRTLFDRLIPLTSERYSKVSASDEVLTGRYTPSWEAVKGSSFNSLEQALCMVAEQEKQRGRALVGPHLDEITLELNGMDAARFGSQGQQRTIVLALKLAEAQFLEETLNQDPVLLLDDVMSELDSVRRQALVENLIKDRQTFITTAHLDYFDEGMLKNARIVELYK